MYPSKSLVGIDHGIELTDAHFITWFLGVPTTFLLLATLFRRKNWWSFILKDSTTRASDDMAFEIVAGGCCLYLAVAGVVGR